jgi:hypothetical protein
MTNAPVRRLPTNPFATRFTRPGELEPLDEQGEPVDAASLLARLGPGRVVAIEGPHGHGKSTLLAAIMAAARADGWATAAVRVRSPFDAWRPIVTAVTTPQGGLVGCDGWERAAPGTAAIVRLVAAARGLRVVVTTHRPGGLRLLARCGTSPRLLAQLVMRLPDHGGLIAAADIDDAFHRHAGNLREALYDLYDRFERRARGLRPPASGDRPHLATAGWSGESSLHRGPAGEQI